MGQAEMDQAEIDQAKLCPGVANLVKRSDRLMAVLASNMVNDPATLIGKRLDENLGALIVCCRARVHVVRYLYEYNRKEAEKSLGAKEIHFLDRGRMPSLQEISFLSGNRIMTMNDIESQRQENIKRNREQLTQLGIYLTPSASSPPLAKGPPAKKRKLDHPLPPSRSSARIASTPAKPSYVSENEAEDWRHSRKKGSRVGPKKAKEPVIKQEAVAIAPISAKDIESIRAGWITWESNASPPIRDDDSTFHFQDQSSFTPNKSPEELIREGCFGGSYFRPLYSRRLGITVTDDYRQLPSTWYAGLDVSQFLTSPTYDMEINKYKVSSGQSIEEWEAAGWINHTYDVRGWFQWYCRFYMGRRCEDDERQISRWRKCVGETGRWRRMLLKKYVSMGIKEVFDDGEDEEGRDVSPVMHQTCHHWAYEVRQGDLERFWNAGK